VRLRGLILVAALGHLLAQGASVYYSLELAVSEGWELTGEALISGVAPVSPGELVFRLYPCALIPDALTVKEVGAGLDWDQVHPTTFTVSLPGGSGQTFSLSISFRGKVPELNVSKGYGIFAHSPTAAVLSQAYPILAPRHDGAWLVEPIFPWGDAVVAAVADYSARVTLPTGWSLVATGEETQTASGVYLVEGENLRELVLVALRGYQETSVEAGEVLVRGYFLPGHREAGEAALEVTAQALLLYSRLFGPYPFPELDVVEVSLKGAAGVEYPGLILAGETYLERYPADPLFFTMIFAHEVAHQWWYAQVGNDQVAEPWLDEALTTYSSGLYFESVGMFADILSYWQASYQRGRARNPTATVASPLWEFPDGAGYGGIVYSGGALFLHEVRLRMGDTAFLRGLRRYLEEYRWRIATGRDLLSILREESPTPLEDIIQEWLGTGYKQEVSASAPNP